MRADQLPGAPDFANLVDVRLLQLPVPLWARAQEHSDELFREFALIASDPAAANDVPARLTKLIETLNATYAGVSTAQESQLLAAAADDVPELDVAFAVPAAAAAACLVLGALLDEADEHCAAGEHLLTLATPPDLLQFRRWYLDQFVEQIGGAVPVPWPEYGTD